MPNRRWLIAVVLALLATHAGAQTTQPDAAAEAAYTADITKRADDAIKFAGIDDAKAPAVRQTLVSQYRNLRTIHDARDAKLKAASDDAAKTQIKSEADASLKKLHDEFVTKLSSELPAEQVEKVKDKLTYNVVNVTYNAYCDELPQLTDSQKTYILAQLKEAREIAMDQGSSKDKHAVFGKYKGRINNYLAREGYDLKKAEKEWAQRRKAREASAKQTARTPEQKPQKQD